jgi:hypothetical protein
MSGALVSHARTDHLHRAHERLFANRYRRPARLVLVATTFLVLGFLLGACADQYKTFAGAYSDVIDIYRSCTFGP